MPTKRTSSCKTCTTASTSSFFMHGDEGGFDPQIRKKPLRTCYPHPSCILCNPTKHTTSQTSPSIPCFHFSWSYKISYFHSNFIMTLFIMYLIPYSTVQLSTISDPWHLPLIHTSSPLLHCGTSHVLRPCHSTYATLLHGIIDTFETRSTTLLRNPPLLKNQDPNGAALQRHPYSHVRSEAVLCARFQGVSKTPSETLPWWPHLFLHISLQNLLHMDSIYELTNFHD